MLAFIMTATVGFTHFDQESGIIVYEAATIESMTDNDEFVNQGYFTNFSTFSKKSVSSNGLVI